ncbi:hypothetical protein HN51_046514 [Arachis hypogaea]
MPSPSSTTHLSAAADPREHAVPVNSASQRRCRFRRTSTSSSKTRDVTPPPPSFYRAAFPPPLLPSRVIVSPPLRSRTAALHLPQWSLKRL